MNRGLPPGGDLPPTVDSWDDGGSLHRAHHLGTLLNQQHFFVRLFPIRILDIRQSYFSLAVGVKPGGAVANSTKHRKITLESMTFRTPFKFSCLSIRRCIIKHFRQLPIRGQCQYSCSKVNDCSRRNEFNAAGLTMDCPIASIMQETLNLLIVNTIMAPGMRRVMG